MFMNSKGPEGEKRLKKKERVVLRLSALIMFVCCLQKRVLWTVQGKRAIIINYG